MMVYPINTDFLEDRDLELVQSKIAAALNIVDKFGIYIQKEQVDFSSFKKNLTKVYEEQENIITQRKQKTLIQYVESVENKLKNIEKFYIVLEDRDLIRLNQSIRKFRQVLSETHLSTSLLSRKKWLKILSTRLGGSSAKITKFEDIYPENAVDYKGIYQIIGNTFHSQITISNYPTEVPDYNWLSSLFKIDESINIAIIGTKKSPVEIVSQMNKNIIGKRHQLAETRNESDIISMENEIESSKTVLKDISGNSSSVFDVCIIVDVEASTEEELTQKMDRIKTIISSMSMRFVIPYRKNFIPFVSTLPLLADNFITRNYTYNFISTDIGSLIIFDNSDFFREDGIPIGKNPKTGSLYAFNPFSGEDFFNPHMMIIGFTGSGKTFFIKYLCERLEAYVDYIIRLDIAGTLQTYNSKKYVFTADGELKFNPFHIRAINTSLADLEDNPNPVTEKILDLIKFFKDIIDNLSSYEISVLESCLQNMFAYSGIYDDHINEDAIEPTFDTLKLVIDTKKQFLQSQIVKEQNILDKFSLEEEYRALSKIASDIRPCTDGAYSKLLNGANNFEYEKDTVLDFSRLPEILKKPIYNLLLSDLWRFVIKDGSNEKRNDVPKKVILIDEEHEFIDQEETLRVIASKFIKQGRKYNCMTINATQDFADLKKNTDAQKILSNCNFKFLFKLGDKDYEEAQLTYSLTNKEIDNLKGSKLSAMKDTAAKGRGILIIDSLHLSFKAQATIEEIKIIDPALYRKIMDEEKN